MVVQHLFSRLSLAESTSTRPHFFRLTLSDLAAFRSLSEDENIMLFTPAVPNLDGENMDPFEPLGRALTAYHERIKHVPFTRDGFTAMHSSFLAYADAVIVVFAEPMRGHDLGLSSHANNREVQQSLQSQIRFGRDVLQNLKRGKEVKALILVACTGTTGVSEDGSPRSGPAAFGTVVCAKDYQADTLEDVAWTIFESEI